MPKRSLLIWGALGGATLVPLVLAAFSPQLAWREPIYIAAGFAGIIGMTLMVFQPLLAAGFLPGLPALSGRRIHKAIGAIVVAAIVLHVAGLWITSPPDVIDALLLVSPTPFSIWGVLAMWAAFATAALAALRRRWRIRWRIWRLCHTAFFLVIVAGTVAHVLLIDGTMETISKLMLCAMLLGVTAAAVFHLRIWAIVNKPR